MKAGRAVYISPVALKIEIAAGVLHILNRPECHSDCCGKSTFIQGMKPAQRLYTLRSTLDVNRVQPVMVVLGASIRQEESIKIKRPALIVCRLLSENDNSSF